MNARIPTIPLTEGHSLLEEKRSRFLGLLHPVSTEDDFRKLLTRWRHEHPKASHIAWAWRLISEGRIHEGFSDDGEPSGTAGMPLLRQLQHQAAVNAGLLVVRYYGGIKLGTGGLQRAYGHCGKRALEALDERGWETYRPHVTLQLRAPFSAEQVLRNLVYQYRGEVTDCHYSAEGISMRIGIAADEQDNLTGALPLQVSVTPSGAS